MSIIRTACEAAGIYRLVGAHRPNDPHAAAVEQLEGNLTIVIIGHRGLSTWLADRQIVVQGGRIASSDDASKSGRRMRREKKYPNTNPSQQGCCVSVLQR